MATPLQLDLHASPVIPTVTGSSSPRKTVWSPINCTLIHGPTSAVLVDTAINVAQNTALADWIDGILALSHNPAKKLTHIYITHAHGDHYFGIPVLQARFPGVKVVAMPKVAAAINATYSSELAGRWSTYFPGGQLAPAPQMPAVMELPASGTFTIDGHELKGYEVRHSDCECSSFLHCPDLDTVVGGDVVYGDCYQHLGEANTADKRNGWLEALDLVESLEPTVVVPGHMRASQLPGRYLIEATRRYIKVFAEEAKKVADDAGVASDSKAGFLEERIKELYPERWNEFILEFACKSYFAGLESSR